MKKSLVAAGIIVALGVVWTGGAWYTGKQLEGRIADMVQQANAQLRSSAPESGLELSYQDYQRGLFSSHLQLVVKPIAGQANGWLAAGQSVVLDEVVDHGPFPLASLKTFNLAPAMASVHTTLVKNDASQALFEIAKGTTPFTVDTRIAYSGDSQSAIVLNALDYAKGDEKVTFSGGQFQLDADRDGKNISLKGQAGSGQIDALNEYNQKVQLRFVNLTTDGATDSNSALALDRFPVADDTGQVVYDRTLTPEQLPDGTIAHLADLTVVEHGIDVDGNGQYNLDSPIGESEIAQVMNATGVPAEATYPAACGAALGGTPENSGN